jgi:hypothetical protein
MVWCDAHLQRDPSLREATRLSRRLFIVPTALIALFAVVALRGQEIAGGPPFTFTTVIAQAFAATSGGPQDGGGLWIVAGIVARCVRRRSLVRVTRPATIAGFSSSSPGRSRPRSS